MNKNIFILLMLLVSVVAKASIESPIQHLDWNGLEVVWLEDERLPLYNIVVYYGDGALSDSSKSYGETSMALEYVDLGTNRFTHKQITDHLDFYGIDYGHLVNHEYSTYSISGPIKDMAPTLKMVCNFLTSANYPEHELIIEKKHALNNLQNSVNDPSSLANHVFRSLTLSSTPLGTPQEGNLKSIKAMTSTQLQRKLDYLQNRVYKKLYISGPKKVLEIQDIINHQCGWVNQKNLFRRKITKQLIGPDNRPIYLVTVPQANQAEVRIGRFLPKSLIDNDELMSLSSNFLGGGFTSELMKELRVKRGLTYGVYAFAAAQKDYGRAGISTFTKNESVVELLKVTQDILVGLKEGRFSKEDFERAKGHLMGSYPFRFERPLDFLIQIIQLDHVEKPLDKLFQFSQTIQTFGPLDVQKMYQDIFSWEDQMIVILGDKSLVKELSKIGKVKIMSYKDFL